MKLFKWCLLIASVFIIYSWNAKNSTELEESLELFGSVIQTIETHYVEEIDANALVLNAIDHTVESLDPFSHFYDRDETIEREEYGWNGILYAGIGINMDLYQDIVTIIGVREGYGAQKNDLRVGDQIIQVDQSPTQGLNASEVADLIKGTDGEVVELTIRRGQHTYVKSIVREFIKDKAIPYFDKFESTGYIKYNHFLGGSTEQLRSAVLDLKERGVSELILDLRGNYGGLINEAVDASSLFMEIGSDVMSQKGRHDQYNYESDTQNFPIAKALPVVVIIDTLTLSAAEIFTGAMQDHDRMVVVGSNSGGKGIVQGTLYPGLGTSLYMTVSAYYIPSGRPIQNLQYPSRFLARNPVKTDSTNTEYFTKNGRKVPANGGISPDRAIDWQKQSPFVFYALNSPLTFDFLNEYANGTSKDELTLDFEFKEGEFEKIFNSLIENSDSIKLSLDGSLATLSNDWKQIAGDELEELSIIQEEILNLKKRGFKKSKTEIKRAFEREIVRRAFYEPGYYRHQFIEDNEQYDFGQYFKRYNEILNID